MFIVKIMVANKVISIPTGIGTVIGCIAADSFNLSRWSGIEPCTGSYGYVYQSVRATIEKLREGCLFKILSFVTLIVRRNESVEIKYEYMNPRNSFTFQYIRQSARALE